MYEVSKGKESREEGDNVVLAAAQSHAVCHFRWPQKRHSLQALFGWNQPDKRGYSQKMTCLRYPKARERAGKGTMCRSQRFNLLPAFVRMLAEVQDFFAKAAK